jgi:hypothetical protein
MLAFTDDIQVPEKSKNVLRSESEVKRGLVLVHTETG